MAGNRAVTQLLARQAKKARRTAVNLNVDLAAAGNYVATYYRGVDAVLTLNKDLQRQAIDDAKKHLELKDPPPVNDGLFLAIFTEVMSLVPGGRLITAAMTTGVFADELSKLAKVVAPLADEGAKARQKTLGKGVGLVKTAIGVGESSARSDRDRQAREVSAQEADVREHAQLHQEAIASWRAKAADSLKQQQAINDMLEAAAYEPRNRGKLKQLVEAWLGPVPELSEALQERLVKKYELALYRRKLTWVTETHTPTGKLGANEQHRHRMTHVLEMGDGGKPSQALLSRIARLLGLPSWMTHPMFEALLHQKIAEQLDVPWSSRAVMDEWGGTMGAHYAPRSPRS
jgi:hypothetical protein